jgi:hypothetical protein
MVGFTCPCGLRFMANDWQGGRAFQCRACGRFSTIPRPAPRPPDAPASPPAAASDPGANPPQEPSR